MNIKGEYVHHKSHQWIKIQQHGPLVKIEEQGFPNKFLYGEVQGDKLIFNHWKEYAQFTGLILQGGNIISYSSGTQWLRK